MDNLSSEKRSWNMSRIKGKNTKPEIIVRSLLFSMGYRFRVHQKDLPGKPDIVLKKFNTVVYVNGCFWHRHKRCKYAYNPKSQKKFWNKKFADTIGRDKKNKRELYNLGWKLLTIWECQIDNSDVLKNKICTFFEKLKNNK